ncbi:hypothetical protein Q4E93_00935 [Flavitalea sp. BT771]|uniref:hypothetical protein n=1 Tax=Flavitalea sp. BT771 TaxID=3063329 RepID=UPI0026E41E4A|nr:hypothetical protein [Flavitalea sp. BT771]MDO6429130.1 hypothetical protein [Flavitalea sp. BT771]MDV6218742.1 hypothetical protein [Flavitalea sp. BT771]
MGFKASMITIHRPSMLLPEEVLLKHLDFSDLAFRETTIMDSCIYPGDRSVNIGYYNDNIVICEDYLLTTSLEVTDDPVTLAEYEQVLSALFPGSEVLTVACHSSVNYHLYSLVKDGKRIRFKRIVASGPVLEHGDRLKEEETIYAASRVIDGKRFFESRRQNDHHAVTEDQLMEEFAFGVAKRHLGVKISSGEESNLMFNTPFKKFAKMPPQSAVLAAMDRQTRPWWKIW